MIHTYCAIAGPIASKPPCIASRRSPDSSCGGYFARTASSGSMPRPGRVEGVTKPSSHCMGSWRILAAKPVQSSIPSCIKKFGLQASS